MPSTITPWNITSAILRIELCPSLSYTVTMTEDEYPEGTVAGDLINNLRQLGQHDFADWVAVTAMNRDRENES